MDHQKIESRMKEIQMEHSKILDEVQKLNKQVQDLTARRIYLEGAFYELEKMMKEDTEVSDVIESVDVNSAD